MKKLIVLVFMLLWAVVATAQASPIYNDGTYVPIQYNGSGDIYGDYVNSGDLVGIMPGNDEGAHFDVFNNYMGATYGVVLTPIPGVTYTGAGDCTGTWSISSAIDYYTVKAGNSFAIYSVSPSNNDGSWSTYDLWFDGNLIGEGGTSLEISHLNGYQASPVPIPAAVLLFGSGCAALMCFNRKRKT